MSDDEAPPTKRTRYSQREATSGSRYMLRSNKTKDLMVEDVSVYEKRQRKRKYRIRKLMQLSCDCLLTIFEHMNPDTLCHIAGTCDRLNNLARYQFRIKHTRFDTASLVGIGRIPHVIMLKIFRTFGDLITSLHLSCFLFNQTPYTAYELLKWVKRYCLNLKTLTIEEFSIPHEKMIRLKPFFQPIEALKFDNCSIDCDNLGVMNQVKSMKVHGGNIPLAIFGKRYAKLEEMELMDLEFLNDNLLTRFVGQNTALKRLSVVNCETVSTFNFHTIGQLKQLEELEFHQYYRLRSDESFQADIMYLASLVNLKVLKLNCTKLSVAKLIEGFVKNKIPLEHLELINGPMDDGTFENIQKAKTIKILRLNQMNGLVEHHVMCFAKELKLLETLHLHTLAHISRSGLKAIVRDANRLSCLKIDSPSLILDIDTYQAILATVQKREQNIKLDLTIHGDGQQLTVPETIANGSNDKWFAFRVKELHRVHNHIFVHQAESIDDDDDDDGDEFDVDDFLDDIPDLLTDSDREGRESDSFSDEDHDDDLFDDDVW